MASFVLVVCRVLTSVLFVKSSTVAFQIERLNCFSLRQVRAEYFVQR